MAYQGVLTCMHDQCLVIYAPELANNCIDGHYFISCRRHSAPPGPRHARRWHRPQSVSLSGYSMPRFRALDHPPIATLWAPTRCEERITASDSAETPRLEQTAEPLR